MNILRSKFFLPALIVFSFLSCKNQPAENTTEAPSAQENTPPAPANNFSGTYAYDNGENGGGELKVLQKGDDIQFSLMVVAGPPAYNQGSLMAQVKIEDNIAKVKTLDFGDCIFTITFSGDEAVIVSEENARDCGFGNGVIADGVYKKK